MSDRPLRIVFFGTPHFAVPSLVRLLQSRHEVVAVLSQPDRPRGRGNRLTPSPVKAAAVEHGVPVWHPEKLRDDGFLHEFTRLEADLGVVAAYGRILPEALLRMPTLGMINVHASLLPRWRGAAPIHRAVIAGDTLTGITIMRVVRELDAGPMFAAVERAIGPDETSEEVERDLADLGAPLLLEVIDLMAEGHAVETPQDESQVTYAAKIAKGEGAIGWDLPAREIHNLVRGLQPWPLVSGRIAGQRVLIHRTAATEECSGAPAGTIVRAQGDRLDVACADGLVLRVLSIQPEGRRAMTAREFLAGHHPAEGARIERE